MAQKYVRWFETLNSDDTPLVGGKNASLGEMIATLKDEGIRVPDGFATTSDAYWEFVEHNGLKDPLQSELNALDAGDKELHQAGEAIRARFADAEFPEAIADAIFEAYAELGQRYERDDVDVAVRSSATAEDLPHASFAGQQESFLNVHGDQALLDACKRCFASLFTDRAISYREQKGFDHMKIALSVGVQKMVRADKAGAGVLFTIDTENGFPDAVVINAAFGLGENVVGGTVRPDQYNVYKPFLDADGKKPIIGKQLGEKENKMVYSDGGDEPTENIETPEEERARFVLDDDEILQLARWAVVIEDHYDRPMDIEWGKDGETGELSILQARPETVHSQATKGTMKSYELTEHGEPLCTGLAIGNAISAGPVCVIESIDQADQFEEGCVLVTEMTDPDWVPLMKKAAGIVTERGGRTSHAAIVSRELGVAAVIGTGDCTNKIKDAGEVTLSCAEGDEGYVYEGCLDFETHEVDFSEIPEVDTQIMMNIASPGAAMSWWKLPNRGIGLARMEYIINNVIQIHPLALTRFDEVEDEEARERIEKMTRHSESKPAYFVDHLAWGIGTIAASQYPDPVVVRMSDFKTNEYADLIGGRQFEPDEANPMLGWRGASRYYSDDYRDGFALECQAIKRVRDEMGFDNVIMMIPFCRTPEEADRVLEVIEENGLERGKNGLKLYVMAEIPTNIMQADEFCERFDGFSIGSNDLTQLTMGVDRDAQRLSYLFDERNNSVKRLIAQLIDTAHDRGCSVGICGEAPSNYPDFAAFLVEHGIDSISLSPDSIMKTLEVIAEVEKS
ncbi:phosphoenolpyruvate synthase [Persicimonas caeni]|uniref:Phosphoenolpyruvate synthase n=1 Tax=Persicimonas caeni TaxID=2292766 RepID=A0A4Y6PPL4_PERCE|nr:phosphoenolpyruvate synthase [Persicimonas caeni]QDG50286.1 phosphoenolpyruvate synthase [Persicimonas caeni]QED31507.1 phosphoenolpyruvate synthase [Persicimonas caeni]